MEYLFLIAIVVFVLYKGITGMKVVQSTGANAATFKEQAKKDGFTYFYDLIALHPEGKLRIFDTDTGTHKDYTGNDIQSVAYSRDNVITLDVRDMEEPTIKLRGGPDGAELYARIRSMVP